MKTQMKKVIKTKKVETRGRKKKEIISESLVKNVLNDLPATRLKKLVIQWLQPKDYGMFHKIAGINRETTGSHVTTMVKNLQWMNICIRPVIVAKINFLDKKPVHYIIDGQHLFEGLIRLNEPVPYLTINISSLEELVESIAMVNSCSKRWTLNDYVLAWTAVYPDYKTLQKAVKIHDIEITTLAGIYGNISPRTAVDIIKSGKFQIDRPNLKKAHKILDNIGDVFKVIPRMDRWSNRRFVDAAVEVMKLSEYNHTKMMSYIKTHKTSLSFVTQSPDELQKFLKEAIK